MMMKFKLTSAAFALCAATMAPLMAQADTLADIIRTDEDLSELEDLLDRTGLMPALEGDGQLTIFAPNNAAIQQIAFQEFTDNAIISEVLLYHVVGELIDPLMDDVLYDTVQGSSIVTLEQSPGEFTVNQANILGDGVVADNGILYKIDFLLLPPDDGESPPTSPTAPQPAVSIAPLPTDNGTPAPQPSPTVSPPTDPPPTVTVAPPTESPPTPFSPTPASPTPLPPTPGPPPTGAPPTEPSPTNPPPTNPPPTNPPPTNPPPTNPPPTNPPPTNPPPTNAPPTNAPPTNPPPTNPPPTTSAVTPDTFQLAPVEADGCIEKQGDKAMLERCDSDDDDQFFSFDAFTGLMRMSDDDDKCLQAGRTLMPPEDGGQVRIVACNEGSSLQQWEWSSALGAPLKLKEYPDWCAVYRGTSADPGSDNILMKRCASVDSTRRAGWMAAM